MRGVCHGCDVQMRERMQLRYALPHRTAKTVLFTALFLHFL